MDVTKTEKPGWIKRCAFDGSVYLVAMKYDEAIKDHFKEWGGFFFTEPTSKLRKSWKIDRRIIEGQPEFTQSLAEIAPGDDTGDSLRRYFSQVEITPDVCLRHMGAYLFRLTNGKVLVRFTGFHPDCVKAIKRIGASFNRDVGAWTTYDEADINLVENSLRADLAIPEEQICVVKGVYAVDETGKISASTRDVVLEIGEYTVDELDEDTRKKRIEGGSHTVHEVIEAPPTDISEARIRAFAKAFPVKAHQVEALVFLGQKTGGANFSEMGTGKTRTHVLLMELVADGKPKLVTCPNAVVMDWKEEIQARFPKAKVATKHFDPEADWIVTTLESLPYIPVREHFGALSVDEAHLIKEPSSQRTKRIMDLADLIPNRYVLTGTPVLNRAEELHTLLKLTRHPLGLMDLQTFRSTFCGDAGARGKLAAAMRGWYVRHRKDHVLKLPAKHREETLIELNKRQRKDYEELLADDRAGLHHVRRFLEEEKLLWLSRYVAGLPDGDKVVIFTQYRDTLNQIKDRLGKRRIKCVTAHGADTDRDRHASVVALREDEGTRAYAGTILANNAGLNLQRANHAIFMSPPWTAAWMMQAEDRTHRMGQEREVYVQVPLFSGTIDEQVMDLIRAKAAISSDLIDPKDQESTNRKRINQIVAGAKKAPVAG